MASHYSIHIQTQFQFSLLPIHVIENRQLIIQEMPSIFLFQVIQYSKCSQFIIFIKQHEITEIEKLK